MLADLSQRVDSVKDENFKLKSENQVLGWLLCGRRSICSNHIVSGRRVHRKSDERIERFPVDVAEAVEEEGWRQEAVIARL